MSPTCPRGRGGCSAPHPARPRLSRPSPVRSFCCLYFVATFLSWKEEIAGALQAEAGGSPADSHLSPLTPTRPTEICLGREAAIRGEGGPSGWTLKFSAPCPEGGKFFLLCLVCYNLKGKRRHLHPPAGVRPPARVRSHLAVEFPHIRGLVLRPPLSLWRGLMNGHYGGAPS